MKLRRFIQKYASKKWYLPLITFLVILDAYVFVVPNEVLLVGAVAGKPRRWLWMSFWVTLGSALGAVSLAYLASRYGEAVIHWLWPKAATSRGWRDSMRYVQAHGAWGLALVSLSPFPQHFAVAIAGLAHMSMSAVFVAVFAGRFVKYVIVAWCAVHAPRALRFFRIDGV